METILNDDTNGIDNGLLQQEIQTILTTTTNNDSNTDASLYTGSSALQGIYRCDTGLKILNSSNAWKMGSAGSTLSNGIRFFHYYSTDASAKLQWAKPGFYEINGDEPTLSELLSGGAS